jgi:hypothetical protein
MPLALLEDEWVGGPIYTAARTPKPIASAEVLWGPNPLAPTALLPPPALLAPEAGDPPPLPDPDTTPLPNDLTVTVGSGAGQAWVYSTQRTVSVPINDTGTGSAAGPLSDPVTAGIVEDDLIRFTLRGTAILLGKATTITGQPIAPEEEAGQFKTVHANGIGAEWAECIVYPDLGAGAPERMAPPRQETRIFNYSASTGVDDSSWTPAVPTDPKYGDPDDQRFTRPEGWPDPLALPIWDRDSSVSVPVGTMRFRRVFAMPAGLTGPLPCQLWVAADGLGEASLNGIKMFDIPGPYAGQSFHSDVVLGAHFHLFTAELTNFIGRSGLWWSVLPIDGDRLGPAIARSDPSTKAKGYGNPTSFSPGKVIRILYAENRVRGGPLISWTCAFTDDVDSNGQPWPEIFNYQVRVGLDYLSVLKQLAEQWIDFRFSPSARTLYAYRLGEMGTVSAAPVLGSPLRGMTVEVG